MDAPYKLKRPADLESYILRVVADKTYLIFERKKETVLCTRCGKKEKSTQPETMACCKHPDCYYYSAKNTVPTCDYILRTGVPRGCKVSECDKYKPRGKEKNKSIVIFDRLTEEKSN